MMIIYLIYNKKMQDSHKTARERSITKKLKSKNNYDIKGKCDRIKNKRFSVT